MLVPRGIGWHTWTSCFGALAIGAAALLGACKRQPTTIGPAASADPVPPRDAAPDVMHEGCVAPTERHRDAFGPRIVRESDVEVTVVAIGWCFHVDLRSGAYRRCKEGAPPIPRSSPTSSSTLFAQVREGAVEICKNAGGCFASLVAPGCHSAYTGHKAGPLGPDSCGVALRTDGVFAAIESAPRGSGTSETWLYEIGGSRLVKHFASTTSECAGPRFMGERLLCRGALASEILDPKSGTRVAVVGGAAPIRAASELRPDYHDAEMLETRPNDTPLPIEGNVWAFEGIDAAVIVLQDVVTGDVRQRVDLAPLFPKDASGRPVFGTHPTASAVLTHDTLVVVLSGGAAGDVVTIDTRTGAIKNRYQAPVCVPVPGAKGKKKDDDD